MGVKDRFVRNVLEEEGRRMLSSQSAAIGRAVRFRSGRLFNDRSISVSGGADMDGKLTFTHTDYERFLDLRRRRHGTKTSKSNKKIHNRYVFGAYSSIASRLMYDLTDDVAESIRKQMEGSAWNLHK